MSRRNLATATYVTDIGMEDTHPTPLPLPIVANNPAGGGLPPPMTIPTDPIVETMAPQPMPPIPTAPYPPPPPITAAPVAWFKTRPWILPVGGGLVALLVGLSVGLAIGRGRRA